MAKDEQAKEEICINRIFPKSTYLANETNLGHEIINLYKCDNGKDYIYLMPSGDYSSTHNGKIKTILIVRGITSDCVEVIAKATDLEPFFNYEENEWKEIKGVQQLENINKGNGKYNYILEEHYNQVNKIKENDIKYGGVYLNELFPSNEIFPLITFQGTITKAKEPIYLYCGENNKENMYYIKSKNRLAGQKLATYYSCGTDDYKMLQNLIENSNLWDGDLDKFDLEKVNKSDDFCFMNLIKGEYLELLYSNMLSYFLSKYKEITQAIFKDDVQLSNDLTILREYKNIDILIIDKKNNKIIVVENKIKSKINGEKHDVYGEIIQNQLDEYVKTIEEQYNKYSRWYYILTPNYNKISNRNFSCKNKESWKVITYKDIYDIVIDFQENEEQLKNNNYITEFIKAIKIHTSDVDNNLRETANILMKEKIEALRDINKKN